MVRKREQNSLIHKFLYFSFPRPSRSVGDEQVEKIAALCTRLSILEHLCFCMFRNEMGRENRVTGFQKMGDC